uniref:DUF4083 domain-containing protein n=1 Tax=Exiguobacterium arabatum TaxID=518693 RepID=B2G3I5_9BACL|nr:hypothetical protein [Exiguobacterium arabatum]
MTSIYLTFFSFVQIFLPIIVSIVALILIFRFINRYEKKSEERSAIEKQQLDYISNKVNEIEKLLKQID